VDQLAARDFYLAAGLGDIWPERAELLLAERRTVLRQRPGPGGTVLRSAAVPDGGGRTSRVSPRLLMMIGGAALVVVALVAVVIFALQGGGK